MNNEAVAGWIYDYTSHLFYLSDGTMVTFDEIRGLDMVSTMGRTLIRKPSEGGSIPPKSTNNNGT